MKNFKFTRIIDNIFINFLIFLISFAWLRFLTKKIFTSFILSLFFILLFNFIKYFFNKSKEDKIKITKNLEQDIENYNLTLLSNNVRENLAFFAKLLEGKIIKKIEKENLILYHDNNDLNNLCSIIALSPMYFENQLNFDLALKQINFAIKNKAKTIIFCCNTCLPKTKIALENIDNIKVIIYDKNLTYKNLFTTYNLYPEIKFKIKKNKKIKFKDLITISFDKSRAKGYFFSGLFIFFCSFFVQYNFYYVFMSSLLFLFAILSKTKKDNL